MPEPPEVSFHRFFRTLSAVQKRSVRGKHDIREPEFDQSVVRLLLGIQKMMNDALAAEAKDVPDHAPHGPFHFDYVDADYPNAMAFSHDGYSFIGITTPFVKLLLDVARCLARSSELRQLLAIAPQSEDDDRLVAVFARLQVNSIVAHEWAHHVHGHVPQVAEPTPFDEFAGMDGNLDQQARELDADGYSAYLILSNLFESPERIGVLEQIGSDTANEADQDERLLGLFLCAHAGQFFARPYTSIAQRPAHDRSHPPSALRMDAIVQHAIGWCKQRREHLVDCSTLRNLGFFVNAVAHATTIFHGGVSWDEDIAFLRSPDGRTYCERLNRKLQTLKDNLGSASQT